MISCLVLPGANARSVAVTVNPEEVHTALVCLLMFLYLCMAICLSLYVNLGYISLIILHYLCIRAG